MKKTFFAYLLTFALAFCFLIPAPVAFAADNGCTNSFLGIPTWYKYLNPQPPNCDIELTTKIVNDDGTISEKVDFKDIWLIGFAIIEILSVLAGIAAVVFVIIGGFKFITAQGAPDKTAEARNTILNALVGVLIAIVASRVVAYVAGKLATGEAPYGLISTNADSGALVGIFNIVFTIIGAISVLMITIAGFQFITSSGNPEKVTKARNAIYYSLIGILVTIFATALVNFVIDKTT